MKIIIICLLTLLSTESYSSIEIGKVEKVSPRNTRIIVYTYNNKQYQENEILIIEITPTELCYATVIHTKPRIKDNKKNKVLLDSSNCTNKSRIKINNNILNIDTDTKIEYTDVATRKFHLISIAYGFKNNPQDELLDDINEFESLIDNDVNSYYATIGYTKIQQLPKSSIYLGPFLNINLLYILGESKKEQEESLIISFTNVFLRFGFFSRVYLNKKQKVEGFFTDISFGPELGVYNKYSRTFPPSNTNAPSTGKESIENEYKFDLGFGHTVGLGYHFEDSRSSMILEFSNSSSLLKNYEELEKTNYSYKTSSYFLKLAFMF